MGIPGDTSPELAVRYPQTSFHHGEFARVIITGCRTYPDREECDWELDLSLETPENLSGGKGRVVDLHPNECNVLELWRGFWWEDEFIAALPLVSENIRMARDILVIPVFVHSFLPTDQFPNDAAVRVLKNLFDKTDEIDAMLEDRVAFPEEEWEWARMFMDSTWAQCGVQFRFHGFAIHTLADTPSIDPFFLYGDIQVFDCDAGRPIGVRLGRQQKHERDRSVTRWDRQRGQNARSSSS